MTVALSQTFIPVHDPDEALGFYRDALGLEVRLDVSSDGFRWVTVGTPTQDVDIVLFQPHGGRSQAEGDALLKLVTQGSMQAAIFRSMISTRPSRRSEHQEPRYSRSRRPNPGAHATARSATPRATSSASPRPDQAQQPTTMKRKKTHEDNDVHPVGWAV